MPKVLLHEIYGNVLNTVIAIIVLLIAYTAINIIFTKNIDTRREKKKIRIRLFYVMSIIFLMLMARIWVEGFTHLLAIFGLVSAALVITNKETIMNFIGWLIITWRELFAEDDLIIIQQHKGYIKSIGVLYFTLFEVSEGDNGHITGRIIRIPNGLVANNPLINLSQTLHLLEQVIILIITPDSDVTSAVDYTKKLVSEMILKFYKDNAEYSVDYLKKRSKQLASKIKLDVNVGIALHQDKPSGTQLKIRYYCFSQDAEKLKQAILLNLLTQVKKQLHVKLSYVV